MLGYCFLGRISTLADTMIVEIIHRLIRFNKTKSFLWNKNNTDRSDIYMSKAHATHTQEDKFRKGWLVISSLFRTTSSFTNPYFLWENFKLLPLSQEKFGKLTPILHKERIPSMALPSFHTNSRELTSSLKLRKQTSKKVKHQIRNTFTIQSL